ncbi:hypothetical protein ACFPM0_05410 [Pseudonocardia sulfidoxydans]
MSIRSGRGHRAASTPGRNPTAARRPADSTEVARGAAAGRERTR